MAVFGAPKQKVRSLGLWRASRGLGGFYGVNPRCLGDRRRYTLPITSASEKAVRNGARGKTSFDLLPATVGRRTAVQESWSGTGGWSFETSFLNVIDIYLSRPGRDRGEWNQLLRRCYIADRTLPAHTKPEFHLRLRKADNTAHPGRWSYYRACRAIWRQRRVPLFARSKPSLPA